MCVGEHHFSHRPFPFSPAKMDAIDGLLFSSMWCHPITVLPPARMLLRPAAATARQKWPGLLPEFSQKCQWPAMRVGPPARTPKRVCTRNARELASSVACLSASHMAFLRPSACGGPGIVSGNAATSSVRRSNLLKGALESDCYGRNVINHRRR